MNINLHIKRLVLDGVTIGHGTSHLLQVTLEAELARLLIAGGLAPTMAQGGALPRVSASTIQIQGEVGAAELGRQIAGSVYSGIGK